MQAMSSARLTSHTGSEAACVHSQSDVRRDSLHALRVREPSHTVSIKVTPHSNSDALLSRWSRLEQLSDAQAQEIWEWFVLSYAPLVTALLRRMGCADAEEATAEFWGYLFERRGHITEADRERRFRAFLLGFVRNFALERARSGRRLRTLDSAAETQVNDLSERESTYLWAQSVLEQGLSEIERTRPNRGEVIRLFYGLGRSIGEDAEKLSISEVADRLGLAVSTISPMLTEARKLLRHAIERHLRETVTTDAQLEEEVQALFEALQEPHPGIIE